MRLLTLATILVGMAVAQVPNNAMNQAKNSQKNQTSSSSSKPSNSQSNNAMNSKQNQTAGNSQINNAMDNAMNSKQNQTAGKSPTKEDFVGVFGADGKWGKPLSAADQEKEEKTMQARLCRDCEKISGEIMCARVCGKAVAGPAAPNCTGGVCSAQMCKLVKDGSGKFVQKCTTHKAVSLDSPDEMMAKMSYSKVTRSGKLDAATFGASSSITGGDTVGGVKTTVSYDTKTLSAEKRDLALGKISLKAGEEMKVNCGGSGCDLCQGAGGCKMEKGSVVKVDGGMARLPKLANGASKAPPMTMNLAKGATLRVDRDQELLGQIDGDLMVGAGTTTLAKIKGSANISIGVGAKVVFAGDGDSDVTMENEGELSFTGNTRFKNGLKSTGKLSVSGGAKLEFVGTVAAEISGLGIESFGEIAVGDAGLTVRAPMNSYGGLNVSKGSSMNFEPKDNQVVSLKGTLPNSTSLLKSLKQQFASDVATKLSIDQNRVRVESMKSVNATTDRRRRLGETQVQVTFSIKPNKNSDKNTARTELKQVIKNLPSVISTGTSLAGMTATKVQRDQQVFESVIGGSGLRLEQGSALEINEGNVTFAGVLDSAGSIDIGAGGRVMFASAGVNKIKGDGLISAADSTVSIGQGELQMGSKFQAAGIVDIAAGSKLSLNSSSGANKMTGPSVKLGQGAEIQLDRGSLEMDTDMSSDGFLKIDGGEMSFKKKNGDSRVGGEGMSIGKDAKIDMQQGKVKFEGPMSSRGKISVGASGKASFATNGTSTAGRRRLLDNGQHVAAGEGLVVLEGGVVDIVSASLSVYKLDSAGVISLGTSSSGRRLLDSRRRLETGSGDVAIGEGGLNSQGLITVPAGATFTFNTNNKATSTIAGQGMDNNGKVSIVTGDVTVAAGGIRSSSSTSEVALSGGKLDFASTAPSVIGGKGITIGAGASVEVTKGTVGFTAKITGKVAVKGMAKVVLSTASGATCGGSITGSACTVAETVSLTSLGGGAGPLKQSGVGRSQPAALLLGLVALLVLFQAN